MRKKTRIGAIALVAAALVGFVPVTSPGQQADKKEDFTLRIDGPAKVDAGESIGALWVIGHHADVKGTVHELVVINGSATIDGTVTGNVVLLGARADLGPAARVGGDVLLYRSDIDAARGSTIAGAVHNEAGVSFGARALWFFWASVTMAFVMLGIALAYVAGPSLDAGAATIRVHTRETAVSALLLIFGLPAAAILSFMTGVGVVLGLMILFMIIPIVAFVGYFTVGLAVGQKLIAVMRGHPATAIYASMTAGILALQVLAIVPVVGGLIVLLAGQVGAGALLYRTWARQRRSRREGSLIIQPA